MKIEEVQSTTKKQRVATHTHIKGLGLEVCSFPFLQFNNILHLFLYLHENNHIFSYTIGPNGIDFEFLYAVASCGWN